jgi:glycosyltransferase involved in cell wall biosynthesis
MDISVIIPTLNRDNTLEQCLQSIRANKTDRSYEIIICDAGSTDKTLEIAHQYADKVIMGEPNRINHNIALKQAQGQVIMSTDSDCIVPENWIDGLWEGLFKYQYIDKLVGVGGGSEPWLDNPTNEELAIAKAMRSPLVSFKARNTANYPTDREVQHNPPINSAYFKYILDIFEYDERKHYGEDLDLDSRLIEEGYKLYYLANVVVKHKHRSTYKAFADQMRDFGYKRIKVNRVHPAIRKIYHYAPAVLALMIYSPFIIVPFSMALLNGVVMDNWSVVRLTMTFYRNYGLGELEALGDDK